MKFWLCLLTFILVCASVFTVLVILMQRPSANAGMGAALGGGAAEAAFGGDTTRVLTKWTASGIITFFVVSFILSMLTIRAHSHRHASPKNIDLTHVVDAPAESNTSETAKE